MDDLLDLNWSSSSSGGAAPLQPQSAATRAGAAKTAPSTSSAGSFDFLSAAPLRPSSATSSRSTPGMSSLLPQLLNNAAQRPASGTATPKLNSASGGPSSTSGHATPSLNDAFSGLLSLDGSASGMGIGANKNMTMAQRQKAMEEEKKRNEEKERAMWGDGDFWAKQTGNAVNGAGSSTSSTSSSSLLSAPPASAQRAKSPLANGLDDLLKPTPAPARPSSGSGDRPAMIAPSPVPASSSSSGSKKMGSLWDNPDFLASTSAGTAPAAKPARETVTPGTASRTSPQPPLDPFDFDALEAAAGPSKLTNGTRGHTRSPFSAFGDDDFRGEGPSDNNGDDDEDDLLGELGKPASIKPSRSNPATSAGPAHSSRGAPAARSSSPPPHILGQIVEMGFSPAQARSALAKTSTGLDVQAALELLLNGGGTANGRDSGRREETDFSDASDGDDDRVEAAWREREAERERQRARRQGPSRDAVKPRSREEREAGHGPERAGPGGSQAEYDYQAQADKVLAQATEMGQNIMSKATSFWAAGKEKAIKVYEEQKKAREAAAAAGGAAGAGGSGGAGSRPRPPGDGRPRWMIDAEEAEKVAGGAGHSSWKDEEDGVPAGSGFRDDDSPPRPKNANRLPVQMDSRRPRADAAPAPRDDYVSPKDRADLLFNDDPPVYKPANRHRKPVAPLSSAPRTPQPASTPRAATPVPVKTRPLVSASQAQVQAAATARAKGNEHFKLGRFSEAEAAYSNAASQLPEGHLLLIPIWNNRATARLKLGQSDDAAADCSSVIDTIGLSYHPSKEAPLPSEYAEVKLGESLVKAVTKRAQAHEMGEKWKKALEDWERLMAMDPVLMGSAAASTRNLAAEGARRARKMLEPQQSAATSTSSGFSGSAANGARARPATAPSARPGRPANPDRSAAVSELRKAAAAQDAEDNQRAALKDSVDARLIAWKGGKETNLRALIASLDMVLWDEMIKAGGLKVGMHELITEKQVKIRYMKVIARLHPDKLNVDNTTVEQRMLANGAFSALSDAWQAFSNA